MRTNRRQQQWHRNAYASQPYIVSAGMIGADGSKEAGIAVSESPHPMFYVLAGAGCIYLMLRMAIDWKFI